jgi:DNA-binding response OmpR family regulator
MSQLIFVVEGDNFTRQLVRQCLEQEGYAVRTFPTIRAFEEIKMCPSLVLLDAAMPDGNGLDLCRHLRCNTLWATVPILALLESQDRASRVSALESGANDTLTKPIQPTELIASVQAALQQPNQSLLPSTGAADLIIDTSAMKLSVSGVEVTTTALEFRLVDYLARHRGRVLTRDALLDAVWGEMQFVTPRSVDACIRRIRKKIEHDRRFPTYLKTIRGVGYRMDAYATWRVSSAESCDCAACSAVRSRSDVMCAGPRRSKPARPRPTG